MAAAARKIRRRERVKPLTTSQLERLVRFPAVRKLISKALVRTAVRDVEIPRTGRFVHFTLIDPKECVKGMYATLRRGKEGTLLRICTLKRDVRDKRKFREFTKRMGLDTRTGRMRRNISDAERRDMIYQMRKAGIIGGAHLQSVLIPKMRVEEAVRKLSRKPEVRRALVASNALYTSDGCPKGKVKSRTGKCVKPIGYRAKKGKLYGWHARSAAASRHASLRRSIAADGWTTTIRRLYYLVNISHENWVRKVARQDAEWMKANRESLERRRRVAANPLLATLGFNPGRKKKAKAKPRRNPVMETSTIDVPFRPGQKVSPAQIERWLNRLPEGKVKQRLVRRYGANADQYGQFHLGSKVQSYTVEVLPIGSSKGITDIDFVTSEGKEFAAAYQVPKHSGKYKREVDGRYIHAHGESGIDLSIRRPKKRKVLPDRFHTPDGKFIGVIPRGKVRIDDWYRG